MKRLAAIVLFLLAGSLRADIVTLNDGTRLEGELKRTPDGYLITEASGKQTLVAASDIRGIERKRSASTPAGAEQSLASLRRSLESLSDPASAVQRLGAFISQNPGTPAATDAAQDLRVWQERADKHLTRVADQWLTHEQLVELQSRGSAQAVQILPIIQAANPAEALAAVDKALASAPNNPALLYLKGVVLYRQNQLVPARKAFETVAQAFSEHAPTHNNLAVILFQTHAVMPAMLEYDKAMLADPQNRQILDNVAEALHALPASAANNPLAKKVKAEFDEQDAGLQTKMAAQGLKRSGSQWVSQADFDAAQAAQKAAQDKLDSYKGQALTLQTRLMEIDREIIYDKQLMQGMTQETNYVDVNSGRVRQEPLPPRYYELQQKVASLTAEQLLKQQQLQQLPKLAAEAQQAATVHSSFTGKQTIFDEHAMPGTSPTTRPATQP
jgi:Flp pilus assembly protein TadD